MGKEHPSVADFICQFNLLLLLWSQNYLIPQLNQMSVSVFILKELYKTHWTFNASVECLSFCLIDFAGSFLFPSMSFFSLRCLPCCGVGFFSQCQIVSQQALRCALYYKREMSHCHVRDSGLFCFQKDNAAWGMEVRSNILHQNLQIPETMPRLCLAFRVNQPVNWMQNWNAKSKMLLQGATDYGAGFQH